MNENLNKSSNNELKENKYNFRLYKNDSIVKIQKYLTLKFLADNKTKINGSKKEKEFSERREIRKNKKDEDREFVFVIVK